ncbi:MAG: hypothetical protein CL666_10545 [Balneola sp.]|nr:hypothetical protein [Balneola sp.]|tara:strand:- start:46734 stop:47954 length:1221 start_codon:yes stop_codon:yes gene_type:complete
MDFQKACDAIFTDFEVSIVGETEESLHLEAGRAILSLDKLDLEYYYQRRSKIVNDPETSIFYNGYFEQFVEPKLAKGSHYPFGTYINERLENSSGNIRVDLSQISNFFILFLIDNNLYNHISGRYPDSFLLSGFMSGDTIPFNRLSNIAYSIKVTAEDSYVNFSDKNYLHKIAKSALFNISYSSGKAIVPLEFWDKKDQFFYESHGRYPEFPVRNYNEKLISYHNLALSSASPIFSYLALYNIIEYFFISSSEKVLYSLVSDKISSPTFSIEKPKELKKLVDTVRKQDQRSNEQKMLEMVLGEYFELNEIKDWIKDYEEKKGIHYSESNNIFDKQFKVELKSDKFANSIARRIYHIRNIIVHNKEDLKETRLIPFGGQEEIISKELPLMYFISESIIIKTGSTILT